jgi:hypothetical protein
MKMDIQAVEMTRHIRDLNYERTRNMTHAQRLVFYREQAEIMRAKAKALLQNLPPNERVQPSPS